MNMFREMTIGAALILLALLLGAGVYESVVLAPNFQAGAEALEHLRQFMQRASPGSFFRVFAPLSVVALVVALVLAWRIPQRRWLLLAALGCILAADVITFAYHYPRNHILLRAPLTTDPALLARAAQEWALGNVARFSLALGAFVCALLAFRIRRAD